MIRGWFIFLLTFAVSAVASQSSPVESASASSAKKVVIVPVQDEIASPALYILRRGLKQAIEEKADVVVLDMKTPGGALDVTFEMMEALAKFPGETVTFVNNEAMSAGAFISATTGEIWFSPDGIIGAAAPVQAGGKDVDATMKLKVTSYLRARMRAISEGKAHRGPVISAMLDSDYELKIGDEVLKPKGELLSLTAAEALKTYGSPPQPLLATGIAKSVDELLAKKFGEKGYVARRLEVTWSERLAVVLNRLSPLLLGIGLLALFIEFKTPGFGFFGIAGIFCLGVVFLANYAAGMSGHEPALIFVLGLALVALEVFFFPGIVVVAVAGLVMMLGSLVWAMADLWPGVPLTVAWSGDAFATPLRNLGLGLLLSIGLGLLLAKFMPRGWIWDRLILGAAVDGAAQISGGAPDQAVAVASLIGSRGKTVTVLRPSGQVEIAGRRYEAQVLVGAIDAEEPVIVTGRSSFGLVVERPSA